MRLKRIARNGLATLLYRSGLYRLPSRADGVTILRYHSVVSDPAEARRYVSPDVVVSAADFAKQMVFVKEHFECVDLLDALHRVRDETAFDGRSKPLAAVTFDDGYADNYTDAWPVLNQLGLPATIFLVSEVYAKRRAFWNVRLRHLFFLALDAGTTVTTLPDGSTCDIADDRARETLLRRVTQWLNGVSAIDREAALANFATALNVPAPDGVEFMLTPAQIREMVAGRISFGSHTCTHPNLAKIDGSEAAREIAESKAELERLLGIRVSALAFPNPGSSRPHVTEPLATCVTSAGYVAGLTSEGGLVTKHSSWGRLPRVGVGRKTSEVSSLAWKLARTPRADERHSKY